MSNRSYPPLDVYKNIHHFLKNRNLELVWGSRVAGTSRANSSKDYLTDDSFIKNIQFDKFVIVEAKDSPTKDRRYIKSIHPTCKSRKTRTFIIIMDRTTDAIKSQALQKILMKLPDIKAQNRNFNMDVILVSEIPLTNHPIKKLQEYETKGTENVGYINFVHVVYTLLIMNIFDHISVPAHRILSRKDEVKVLNDLKIKKSQLPKIQYLDPVSIVLGAVPDDVIEIDLFNENTGYETRYRLVL